MPPGRRASISPDSTALGAVTAPAGGRLRKAPADDPVLGASTPVGKTAEAPAPAERVRSTAGKEKVGFYQRPDDSARARAAFRWTGPQEGHRSFSDFIAAALMREVERLEKKYHDGEPWAGVETGELPTGKPLGS